MAERHTHTAEGMEGLDELLEGCSTCCDGTLRQVRTQDAPEKVQRLIEQARDLCREAAEELRSSARE